MTSTNLLTHPHARVPAPRGPVTTTTPQAGPAGTEARTRARRTDTLPGASPPGRPPAPRAGGTARGAPAAEPTPTLPCRTEDPELWFAEATGPLERAKALCRTCPVQEACLSGALRRREPWGVWGGEILQDGRVVASKRGRGRPPKQDSTAA